MLDLGKGLPGRKCRTIARPVANLVYVLQDSSMAKEAHSLKPPCRQTERMAISVPTPDYGGTLDGEKDGGKMNSDCSGMIDRPLKPIMKLPVTVGTRPTQPLFPTSMAFRQPFLKSWQHPHRATTCPA